MCSLFHLFTLHKPSDPVLTHFHILWVEANKGPQKVVFLMPLHIFLEFLLLLCCQFCLTSSQPLLQFTVVKRGLD